MKKFILALGLLIASASYTTSDAQHISVNINIGNQPAWGPVGYDYAEYYYMPDLNIYYNIDLSLFYYFNRGRWISARYLPYSYRNYDLYHMYKVVINDRDPWHHNSIHVRNYSRYKGVRNQVVIMNSKDRRYDRSRNNRVAWYNDNRQGNKHHDSGRYQGRDNNRNDKHYDNKYNNNRRGDNNKSPNRDRNDKKDYTKKNNDNNRKNNSTDRNTDRNNIRNNNNRNKSDNTRRSVNNSRQNFVKTSGSATQGRTKSTDKSSSGKKTDRSSKSKSL